jgi:hypothetical protein
VLRLNESFTFGTLVIVYFHDLSKAFALHFAYLMSNDRFFSPHPIAALKYHEPDKFIDRDVRCTLTQNARKMISNCV